jgi:hypothetical protein
MNKVMRKKIYDYARSHFKLIKKFFFDNIVNARMRNYCFNIIDLNVEKSETKNKYNDVINFFIVYQKLNSQLSLS